MFPEAGWKHTRQVGGVANNETPDFHGRTPANIISGAKANYTAGNIATVSVQDGNWVNNLNSITLATTRRQNAMFRFDITAPGTLITMSNFVDFSHVVEGTQRNHTIKTYVWNVNTLAWVELASHGGFGTPRSMSGPVTAPFTDYVDGTNKCYILIWDYEGTYNSGGTGCVREGSTIQTPSGPVLVSKLNPGDRILSWEMGNLIEALVHEVTHHYEELWRMFTLTTSAGVAVVTHNHIIETEAGDKAAEDLTLDDRMLSLAGVWTPIVSIESVEESCHVYDVQGRCPNFFVGDGIGVNVMQT